MALLIVGVEFQHTLGPQGPFLRRAVTDPRDPDRPHVKTTGFYARMRLIPGVEQYRGPMFVDGCTEPDDIFGFEESENGIVLKAWRRSDEDKPATAVCYSFSVRTGEIWEGRWEHGESWGPARCQILDVPDDFLAPPEIWLNSFRRTA